MWVQELGFLSVDQQAEVLARDEYASKLSTVDSVDGPLSFLAPPLRFSNLVLPVVASLEPYGASPPKWAVAPGATALSDYIEHRRNTFCVRIGFGRVLAKVLHGDLPSIWFVETPEPSITTLSIMGFANGQLRLRSRSSSPST
jgi:hypothetical protein